jgi:hypothetical protein
MGWQFALDQAGAWASGIGQALNNNNSTLGISRGNFHQGGKRRKVEEPKMCRLWRLYAHFLYWLYPLIFQLRQAHSKDFPKSGKP